MKLDELEPELPNTWYHGTSLENWRKIQKAGVLHAKRKHYRDLEASRRGEFTWVRQTWLTNIQTDAEHHKGGEVVLEVNYTPKDGELYNQRLTPNLKKRMLAGTRVNISVTIPIPLSDIKRVK